MAEEGIETSCVRRSRKPTGMATIVLQTSAPATPLDDDLLAMVDVLVVNEHEAVLLGADEDSLRQAQAQS